MTDDLRERVARGICEAMNPPANFDIEMLLSHDKTRERYLRCADAALAEMGKPAPVSVREAARVLLAEHERCSRIPTQDRTAKEQRLATMGRNRLRAIAEGKE